MEPDQFNNVPAQKREVPNRRIRLFDRFFYYYDYFFKVTSEAVRDVVYFFQRVFGAVLAQIFVVISVFFINPMKDSRPLYYKVAIGVPRILIGICLLTALCIVALVGFLIGGTISGILGFRNIADYSLKEQLAAWSILILILLAAPIFLSEFWLFKISLFFCSILLLIGFDFLYGQCGIISLGHSAIVMWGAFLTAFLYNGNFGFSLPFLPSMGLAAATSFLLGILLGLPSLRIKDYYLVIISLAFGISLPLFLRSKYMADYTGIALGGVEVNPPGAPSLFSWMSLPTWNYFFVVGIALGLIIFAYNLMHHSQVGRAFRTIKCDVEVSTIMGIPVVKYKLLAFAMSASFASIAGSLIMYVNHFISADSYGTNDSIDYIVASVIGGPGSILGCTFGGILLTFEKDIAEKISAIFSSGNFLTRMFYGIFMLVMVFVAPRGIAGELTKRLKSNLFSRPKRGAYYLSPPPDYDFLEMKGSTIKKD